MAGFQNLLPDGATVAIPSSSPRSRQDRSTPSPPSNIFRGPYIETTPHTRFVSIFFTLHYAYKANTIQSVYNRDPLFCLQSVHPPFWLRWAPSFVSTISQHPSFWLQILHLLLHLHISTTAKTLVRSKGKTNRGCSYSSWRRSSTRGTIAAPILQ